MNGEILHACLQIWNSKNSMQACDFPGFFPDFSFFYFTNLPWTKNFLERKEVACDLPWFFLISGLFLIFLQISLSHQEKKEVACIVSKPLVSCLWGCGESVNPSKFNIQEVQGALSSSRPTGDSGLLPIFTGFLKAACQIWLKILRRVTSYQAPYFWQQKCGLIFVNYVKTANGESKKCGLGGTTTLYLRVIHYLRLCIFGYFENQILKIVNNFVKNTPECIK